MWRCKQIYSYLEGLYWWEIFSNNFRKFSGKIGINFTTLLIGMVRTCISDIAFEGALSVQPDFFNSLMSYLQCWYLITIGNCNFMMTTTTSKMLMMTVRVVLERRWLFCRRYRSTHYTSDRRCCNLRPVARRCRQITTTWATSCITRRRCGHHSGPPTSWSRRGPSADDSTAGWSTSKTTRCRSIVTLRTGWSSRRPPSSARWKWSEKRPSARNSHRSLRACLLPTSTSRRSSVNFGGTFLPENICMKNIINKMPECYMILARKSIFPIFRGREANALLTPRLLRLWSTLLQRCSYDPSCSFLYLCSNYVHSSN